MHLIYTEGWDAGVRVHAQLGNFCHGLVGIRLTAPAQILSAHAAIPRQVRIE